MGVEGCGRVWKGGRVSEGGRGRKFRSDDSQVIRGRREHTEAGMLQGLVLDLDRRSTNQIDEQGKGRKQAHLN